ncbi:hypothetical protein NDU88_003811 [Pleurodeles waltl]|uniref:Uncharacterized protein n=1 Tax=Pleurodeles waltl TaxID=8319 RepID=A0AAV7UZH4_PLEWA|nr:hypothetical protein NDU88_003811 [Pleurodeles waltl]
MEALGTKIDTLGTDLSLLRDDHHWLVVRVTAKEREFAEMHLTVPEMVTHLTSMETKMQVLELLTGDAETRSSRSIIQVEVLLERSEGDNMITYLESLT